MGFLAAKPPYLPEPQFRSRETGSQPASQGSLGLREHLAQSYSHEGGRLDAHGVNCSSHYCSTYWSTGHGPQHFPCVSSSHLQMPRLRWPSLVSLFCKWWKLEHREAKRPASSRTAGPGTSSRGSCQHPCTRMRRLPVRTPPASTLRAVLSRCWEGPAERILGSCGASVARALRGRSDLFIVLLGRL